jgi:3-dehydroquinate dehydratase
MYSPARKTSSPTIGLDFDDTISNPFMWARIVKILKATNCKVYIVTYRDKGAGGTMQTSTHSKQCAQ